MNQTPNKNKIDTVWITPSTELAAKLNLAPIALPVSAQTAAALKTGRVEPAAIALDIDTWMVRSTSNTATTIDDHVRVRLDRYVAALVYVAALELLNKNRSALAADLLRVGLRHAPSDLSLRAHLAVATWDSGDRYNGLAELVRATHEYHDRNEIAPLLWIFTARALSEAGRHDAALELLEQLAATETRQPLFWDLIDTIEQRRDVAAV